MYSMLSRRRQLQPYPSIVKCRPKLVISRFVFIRRYYLYRRRIAMIPQLWITSLYSFLKNILNPSVISNSPRSSLPLDFARGPCQKTGTSASRRVLASLLVARAFSRKLSALKNLFADTHENKTRTKTVFVFFRAIVRIYSWFCYSPSSRSRPRRKNLARRDRRIIFFTRLAARSALASNFPFERVSFARKSSSTRSIASWISEPSSRTRTNP